MSKSRIQTQMSALKKEIDEIRESIKISLTREKVALIDLAIITLSIAVSIVPGVLQAWRLLIGISGQPHA